MDTASIPLLSLLLIIRRILWFAGQDWKIYAFLLYRHSLAIVRSVEANGDRAGTFLLSLDTRSRWHSSKDIRSHSCHNSRYPHFPRSRNPPSALYAFSPESAHLKGVRFVSGQYIWHGRYHTGSNPIFHSRLPEKIRCVSLYRQRKPPASRLLPRSAPGFPSHSNASRFFGRCRES